MHSLYLAFFLGLLLNIPAIAPVLFLKKAQKQVKVSMAIRLYLLSVFLVLSLMMLSQNITQKYSPFPIWLVFTALGLFVLMLVPTVKFMRKHLAVGKSRAVILSSFLIVYAIKFHGVFTFGSDSGYALNGYNVAWTLFFLFACLLAYLGCAGGKTYAGFSTTSSTSQPDYYQPTKEYETQSQIDYDVAVKGTSVLLDPNLSIVEQQRYRDRINSRNTID